MIDRHENISIDDDVLELVREKMYEYIFPNTPQTVEETDIFEKAVVYQYEHEATASLQANGVPNGVKSFKIGDFSMELDPDFFRAELNAKTICPSARGLLLRAGLLYKGVEGRVFRPCQ